MSTKRLGGKLVQCLVVAALVTSFISVSALMPTGKADAQGSPYDVGLQLYKSGKYAAAATKLLEGVRYPGKEGASYYYLGCCYYKLNRPADARAIYRTVVNNYAGTYEAGLAAQMLQRLDPTYVPPAGIGGATAPKTASAASAAIPRVSGLGGEDMSKLPDEARVPFTTDPSGHMRVTVYLENRPIEAHFDTGANAHFGKNHLAAAGIPMPKGEPNDTSSGWAGTPVPCWRQPMRIKMGNMTRNAAVTVEENMNMTPLVGQEFIQGYQCEVDNGSHYIILRKSGAFKQSSQEVSSLYDIPCVRRHQRDYVNMVINGRSLEVLIDTGADSSTFNPDDLKSIGIRVPDDAPVTTSQGVGGSFTLRTMWVEAKLGPIWKKDFPIHVGGSAGSAVGQDFLGSQRFTIDRERNLMRFFH